MKLHKLISRTVLATALLGATFGGLVAGNNAKADDTPVGNPIPTGSGGTSSGGKTGNFNVQNGLLTLDNVPQLNFVNSDKNSSNILKLDSNNGNDSNGLLEVTDYRNNKENNDWSLTASMEDVNQNTNNNQQNVNKQWKIDLFNNQNNEAKNLDSGNKVPNVNNTELINNGQDQPVMSKSGGSDNGYGVNQINFDSPNDAQLTIPNVHPGTYSTSINWKLNTKVNESSN